MNVVFLGPPGAGKGTQAKKLYADFKLPQISTGDLLRAEARAGTELGRQAKALMDAGRLVPDEVVIKMVEKRTTDPDCKVGFVLDGFPRTIPQAEAIERILGERGQRIDRVISFDVPSEKVVERISGRRSCPADGSIYHVSANPPRRAGFCDKCNAGLVQRDDDKEDKVRARMVEYERLTAPLKAFFSKKGVLTELDGVGSPEGIYADVKKALGK